MLSLWLLGLVTISSAGLKQPWSVASGLKVVRVALRRSYFLVGCNVLRVELCRAVRDFYSRSGEKSSRCWPEQKRRHPPGYPRIRTATDREVLKAKQFKSGNAAA